MDFRPKRNMSTFQPPPRPMIFNIGAEKPRELSMDYVAALPSQRYLYRGENCQLLMSRQFYTDSTATPVFQTAASSQQAMPKVPSVHKSGGGLSSLTSFVGNALTGMMSSLFGQKKMVIPPPFEYQLNEQHIRGVDFNSYDRQKIFTLLDPKLTPVSTPEPSSIFDSDTRDPFLRFVDAAQQVTAPRVVVEEPPVAIEVKAVSESSPKHKKRVKVLDAKPKADKSPTNSAGGEPLLKPLHSPSSFRHSHQKVMNKNRKEKARHEIALTIREDLSDQDEAVDEEPLAQAANSGEEHVEKTETTKKPVPLLTSVSDFPAIPCPVSESYQQRSAPQTSLNNNNNHCPATRLSRSCSECESDDNFIVFASDAAATTPESSYHRGSPKKLQLRCKSITDVLRLKRFGAFRKRQASECSEDSFVVFADDCEGPAKGAEWSDEDDSDDDSDSDVSSSESESEYDSEEDQVDSVVGIKKNVVQLDSGFEEKKVRFNLVPKVNVIRAWDFAYRKARVGPWEEAARDRERFKTRVFRLEGTLAPIFADKHRQQVYSQRFSQVVKGEDNQTRASPTTA